MIYKVNYNIGGAAPGRVPSVDNTNDNTNIQSNTNIQIDYNFQEEFKKNDVKPNENGEIGIVLHGEYQDDTFDNGEFIPEDIGLGTDEYPRWESKVKNLLGVGKYYHDMCNRKHNEGHEMEFVIAYEKSYQIDRTNPALVKLVENKHLFPGYDLEKYIVVYIPFKYYEPVIPQDDSILIGDRNRTITGVIFKGKFFSINADSGMETLEFNNDLIEMTDEIKGQMSNFLEKLGNIVFSDKKDDKAKVEIIQSLFSEGGSSLEEILERINFVPAMGEVYLGALERNKDKFKRVTNVSEPSEEDHYESAAGRNSSSR